MRDIKEQEFAEVSTQKFSVEVITLSQAHKDMTLLEATAEICEKYDVPYEDVCSFSTERTVARGTLLPNGASRIVIRDTINLITTNLYQKLHAECIKNGLLIGRVGTLI